jgi:hypothetical protein
MANGLTKREESKPQPCGRCGLPHIYLGGLCPEDGPEVRAKFDRALDGWSTYQERMTARRRAGVMA